MPLNLHHRACHVLKLPPEGAQQRQGQDGLKGDMTARTGTFPDSFQEASLDVCAACDAAEALDEYTVLGHAGLLMG